MKSSGYIGSHMIWVRKSWLIFLKIGLQKLNSLQLKMTHFALKRHTENLKKRKDQKKEKKEILSRW